MKKLNLSTLSSADLQQLKADIEKELTERSSKIAAIEEIKKLAASKGLRLDDIIAEFGSKSSGRGKLGPAPIRFRHPSDASLTWSGRGKRPNWMRDALASGLSEDSMKV